MSTDKLTFRGQRANEEVVLLMHRHPWYFFKPAIKIIAAVIILTLVVNFFGLSTIFSALFFALTPIIIYIVSHAWFIWTNTMYLLTNERIVAVSQKNWLSRSVTEAPLENIMSVNHEVNGLARSLLNFGNVAIRSSGVAENEIVLVDIYDPFDIQQKILDTAKKNP